MLIQTLERLVLLLKPLLELRARVVVIRDIRDLVIELPSDGVRFRGEFLRHSLRNFAAKLTVTRAGKRKVGAIAMNRTLALFVYEQRVWILLSEPRRRRSCRRPQHNLNVVLCRQSDCTLQPVEME